MTTHALSKHPKHLQAIGTIAVEAVALQVEMADLFGCLLAIPYRTARAIFLAPRAEQTRFDVLRKAAEAALKPRSRNPDQEHEKRKARALRRITKLINRGQEAVNYRHRVVHDHWEVIGGEIKRRGMGGPAPEGTPVPLTVLEAEIKKVRKLIDDVIDLTNEFAETPPTEPKRPRREGPGLINAAPS